MVSCPHRIADVSRSARVVPAVLLTVAMALTLTSCTDGGGGAATRPKGSTGLGDPYFPGLGNGGYEVTHYALTLGYDPGARAHLRATAVVTARATRDLGSFNLDLRGVDTRGHPRRPYDLLLAHRRTDGELRGHARDRLVRDPPLDGADRPHGPSASRVRRRRSFPGRGEPGGARADP